MKVLIIKTGAFGDVVRTTSVALGILRKYPDAEITWATSYEMIPLLRLPRIFPVDFALPPQLSQWREQNYDWVLSLEDDASAIATASRIKTHKLSGATGTGYTDDLAGWFGMGVLHQPLAEANERKKANTKSFNEIFYDGLELGRPLLPPRIISEDTLWPLNTIGINTGAGTRWRYKRWTVAKTVALIDRLLDQTSYNITLCGGEEEKERNDAIEDLFDDERFMRINRPNHTLSLGAFAGVISKLKLLVTSDSLAMHLALAAQIKTVAFFGPTSSAEIDLFGLGEKVVTPLGCRCCYLKDCPIRPTCMDSISVDEMAGAVLRTLAA